jgi:uncharacterized membrane protein required for colicin V production
MTGLDYLLIGIISFFVVYGLVSGFISSVISILSTIIGFVLAFRFNLIIGKQLPLSENAGRIVAFVLIVLLAIIGGKLISLLLKKMLFGSLKLADRLFGGIIGFIEGFAIAFGIVYLLVVFAGSKITIKKNSFSYFVFDTGKKVVNFIHKNEIKQYYGGRSKRKI